MEISTASSQTNPDLLFVRAMMLHEQGFIDEAQPLYARVLQLRPSHAAALHLFGVTHLQQDQLPQAEVILNAALAQEPDNSRILADLGLVYFKASDYQQALHFFNLAIELTPEQASAWNNRGAVYEKMNQLDSAFRDWEKAVEIQPDYIDALLNLGRNYRLKKSYESALRCFYQLREQHPESTVAWRELANTFASDHQYEQAILFSETTLDMSPNDAEQLTAHGILLQQAGQAKQGLSYLLAARTLSPDDAEIHFQCGVLYENLTQTEAAQLAYEATLSLQANHREARYALARLLMNQKQFDTAQEHFELLLQQDKSCAAYWQGIAHLFAEKRQLRSAFHAYAQALKLSPEQAELWNDAAIVLQQAQHARFALFFAKHALFLNPQLGSAWNTLGLIEYSQHSFKASKKALQRAEAIDPTMHEVRWNLAHWHLIQGEWLQGWAGYEARFLANQTVQRHADIPRWCGRKLLPSQTLLVHAEQGFGDTIQMARYLPLLAQQGDKLVVEVHSQLRQLLQPFEDFATIVSRGEPVSACDFQCPMMSLPLMFGTTTDNIPAAGGYLATVTKGIPPAIKPRICFVASGNPHHRNDKARSVGLHRFSELFHSIDAEWVCLQPQLSAHQKQWITQQGALCPLATDSDFVETTAWIQSADLVISVDSAVAHLTGALGKPVWLMLAFHQDWRWLCERSYSPWYNSMRLFRQPKAGDWQTVLSGIQQAWSKHAAKAGKFIAA